MAADKTELSKKEVARVQGAIRKINPSYETGEMGWKPRGSAGGGHKPVKCGDAWETNDIGHEGLNTEKQGLRAAFLGRLLWLAGGGRAHLDRKYRQEERAAWNLSDHAAGDLKTSR